MEIKVLRTNYTPTSTTGVMTLDGDYFGVTLEDCTRRPGVKIFGVTAIPAGRYRLNLSMSKRFGKVLPELHSVPDFEGVRIHGGNTAANTEGCILVARKRTGLDFILGSLSDVLVGKLLGGPPPHFPMHHIEIINGWPGQYHEGVVT